MNISLDPGFVPDGWSIDNTDPLAKKKKLSLSVFKHRQSGPTVTAPTSGRFAGKVLDVTCNIVLREVVVINIEGGSDKYHTGYVSSNT